MPLHAAESYQLHCFQADTWGTSTWPDLSWKNTVVSKSVLPHRLLRIFQLWVVLHMHNNKLVLSSKKCSVLTKQKQNRNKISGFLGVYQSLQCCWTARVWWSYCVASLMFPGWCDESWLRARGWTQHGNYGNLICICMEIHEGVALGWAPALLPAPQASPATGRAGQVEWRRQ